MTLDFNTEDRDTCSECGKCLRLRSRLGRPVKTCSARCARARYIRRKRFARHVAAIKASPAEKAHLEEFARWARGLTE